MRSPFWPKKLKFWPASRDPRDIIFEISIKTVERFSPSHFDFNFSFSFWWFINSHHLDYVHSYNLGVDGG